MIDHISAALKCPVVAGTTKLVLVALADMANQDGVCWPSKAALGEIASVSHRSIGRMTADLEAKGLIRVWVDPRGINTNRYYVDLEAIRKTIAVVDAKARKAASEAALKEFQKCCQQATNTGEGLFTNVATPGQPARHPSTPVSSGITREPPENQNPAPLSSKTASTGQTKPASNAENSVWVRTIWEARYTKRYPGVSPPWTGREGASAKAIAGSLRDACRKTMGPDASEDAVQSRAAERLGAAVDAYLAITESQDKYIAFRCHPFTGLADRLPRLLATPTRGKVQLGAWQ